MFQVFEEEERRELSHLGEENSLKNSVEEEVEEMWKEKYEAK